MSPQLKHYCLITANYWAFTLTDGALRMLVVLHFYQLGYDGLSIAMLFLFYEVFGIVTNLAGGWLGARLGLNFTLQLGMLLQVIALGMLLLPSQYLLVPWVMAAQALSGIAKDLNKMSAKSSIKALVPADGHSRLYRWVALLTGSKNALKGLGFFLGGALLSLLGFQSAIAVLAALILLVWALSLAPLRKLATPYRFKAKFHQVFSKSRAINILSAARLLLFGARDVWFVVALPLTLASQLGWSQLAVGSFLACWVIAYGLVQSLAPYIGGNNIGGNSRNTSGLLLWAALLAVIPGAIALALPYASAQIVLVGGLMLFGAVFAINSSLHSYLIIRFARSDAVSLDVGFYYMANACGRLLGTVLSGWVFQQWGFSACLWVSSAMLLATVLVSAFIPPLND